jgi:hypothetical protein
MSSNRLFAITDYEAKAAEEPLNEDAFGAFLDELSVHVAGFEERLLGLLGRRDLRPLALSNFPGFRHGVGARAAGDGERDIEPAPGSTAAIRAQNASADWAVVVHTGEPGGLPEYVVASGESWFYKATLPSGANCLFHAWPRAKQAGVAANQPHVGQSATSFT